MMRRDNLVFCVHVVRLRLQLLREAIFYEHKRLQRSSILAWETLAKGSTLNLPLMEQVRVNCAELIIVCNNHKNTSLILLAVVVTSSCWSKFHVITWHSMVLSLQLHHFDGTQSMYLHQPQYLFISAHWRMAIAIPATLHKEEELWEDFMWAKVRSERLVQKHTEDWGCQEKQALRLACPTSSQVRRSAWYHNQICLFCFGALSWLEAWTGA